MIDRLPSSSTPDAEQSQKGLPPEPEGVRIDDDLQRPFFGLDR